MSRSFEFGVGATFKQKDQFGNETERSAVAAVRRAGPLPYPETEAEARDSEREREWGHWH